ncbi:TetR/AcrR family transcriptional regulator [Amorphus sp. 3PC139-8]|uniref:TetR/AcrR family transcriptional regulator n=1 Tax=Amorphus sp. 3PC139-8 TaxID=2735676 RepID=UPI00345CDDB0
MSEGPKFRRRKEARPAEILNAALDVFSEKGFAAARLDEIAKRAGLSKGTLYLYYATKEELFSAVITQAIAPDLGRIRSEATAVVPFSVFVRAFLLQLATRARSGRIAPIAKMVIAESRTFPDLARHWHDQAVRPMLDFVAGEVEAAQGRGEVRPGDPFLYALQIVGPFILGILWTETFVPIGAESVEFERLVDQHVATLLAGLMGTEIAS